MSPPWNEERREREPRARPPMPAVVRRDFAVSSVAGGAARGRGRLGDLLAGRREGDPATAERVQALAVGVAGLHVVLEAIERMAVVGDLRRAVGPLGGCDHRGPRT